MNELSKTKYCPKCNQIKPVSEFGTSKSTKDKIDRYCKACRRKYAKGYYKKNKDFICNFDCLNCKFPDCKNQSAPVQSKETQMLRRAKIVD